MSPDDSRFAYLLAVADPQAWRWRFRGLVPSFQEFERSLYADVAANFVVANDNNDAVGICCLYALNLRDQIVYGAVQIASPCIGFGWGLDAAVAMSRFAFDRWPIRKVFFEVPEFNAAQFASAIGRYMIEEARLEKHVYFGEEFHDLVMLSVDSAALRSYEDRRSQTFADHTSFESWFSELFDKSSVLGKEALDDSHRIRIDSLQVAELCAALEDEGRRVEPEAVLSIGTVGELRGLWHQFSCQDNRRRA